MKSYQLIYEGGCPQKYIKRHRLPPIAYTNNKLYHDGANNFNKRWVIDLIINAKLRRNEGVWRLHDMINLRAEKKSKYQKAPWLLFRLYNTRKKHHYSSWERASITHFEGTRWGRPSMGSLSNA